MPDHVVNSAQPCYDLLSRYIRNDLSHIYIALFTGLAIELLALCNVITHMCSMDTTRRKWEVGPEEQHKYVHQNNYNLSADTLVTPSIQSKSRQF